MLPFCRNFLQTTPLGVARRMVLVYLVHLADFLQHLRVPFQGSRILIAAAARGIVVEDGLRRLRQRHVATIREAE